MEHGNERIGYTLLKKGIISAGLLEKALKLQEQGDGKRRRRLSEILVSDLDIPHEVVFREIANIYAFKEFDLTRERVDEKRLNFIKNLLDGLQDSLREDFITNKVLPFGYDKDQKDKLVIIAADPTNRNIPRLAYSLGVQRYEVQFVPLRDLQAMLDQVGPLKNEYLMKVEEANVGIDASEEELEVDEEALDAEINHSMLINLVEGALVEATRMGASDIHVVPKEALRTEFHFRNDGKLHLWHIQDGVRPEAITAVVKDRSRNVDRFERDSAQDGFIQREIDGHLIRYRVSVLPTVGTEVKNKFESIVIRVLDDRKMVTDLEKLGFQEQAKEAFLKAISKPQGMIILTGPTGSGKSTTLVAALQYVMDPSVNVLTVEDPVEYVIRGARQIKLGPKLDFEQALRSILRHDPDIVMVGEMRDKTTAEIAIKLANTGHLTFSTLHTNDAPSAISRLYKMGVEPFLIAYAINIIVAQRLVRTLCEKCKQPVKDLDVEVPRKLGFTDEEIKNTEFFQPAGCNACVNGFKGRAAIHEALYFTKQIRHLIVSAGKEIDEEEIRQQAVKDGMLTLRAAGCERIKRGITTLEEIGHATSED